MSKNKGKILSEEEFEEIEKKVNRSAAILLGSQGGLKGGPARAKKLSPERRSEIARKAARKRWGHPDEPEPRKKIVCPHCKGWWFADKGGDKDEV